MGDNNSKGSVAPEGGRRKWHAFANRGRNPLDNMTDMAKGVLEVALRRQPDALVLMGLYVRGFRVDAMGDPDRRDQMAVRFLLEMGIGIPKGEVEYSENGQRAYLEDVLDDIRETMGEPSRSLETAEAMVVDSVILSMYGLPIPGESRMAWTYVTDDDGNCDLRLVYSVTAPNLDDEDTLLAAFGVCVSLVGRQVILLARRTAETDAANARKERDRAARSSGGEKPEVQDLPCFGRQTRGEA